MQIEERTSNPLTGAFLIAWPAANYRLLMVFFGDGDWEKKIHYIDRNLYPDWHLAFTNGFLIPLAFSIFYVFAYPPIADRIVNLHKKRQIVQRRLALEIENIKPLTQEEANQLRERIAKERLAWKTDRAKLQIEIEDLAVALRNSNSPTANKEPIIDIPQEQVPLKSVSSIPDETPAPNSDGALESTKWEGEGEEALAIADQDKGTWRIAPSAIPEASLGAKYRLADEGISFQSARLMKFLVQMSNGISIPAAAEELHLSKDEVRRRVQPLIHHELAQLTKPDRTERIDLTALGRHIGELLLNTPDKW